LRRIPEHWRLRLGVALSLAALVGAAVLDLRPWWVGLLLASGLWILYGWWYDSRGPGAVFTRLMARWLELPGAHAHGPLELRVHDGMQPIAIHLGREGRGFGVTVATPVPDSTLAFRLWPRDVEAPAFRGTATRTGPADLDRAHAVEALFVQLFRAETNDTEALRQLMSERTMAPILVAWKEARAGFAGVTFDGRFLGLHWRGDLIGDPARAMQLSRPIWRALVEG